MKSRIDLIVCSFIFLDYFIYRYLAAPRPTLGHCCVGRLTKPMLITAFTYFDPKIISIEY